MSEFTPKYQEADSSVEHRNINASGDDHPFGSEPKSFEADMSAIIRQIADDMYSQWWATLREYVANAETACLKVVEYQDDPSQSLYDEGQMIVSESYQPRIDIIWNKKTKQLIIRDNGIGMAASEVDEVFRQIKRSTSMIDGSKSGMWGQGALSFPKFIGRDNAMVMTSHSRLNDDNAAYLVSLAGVEPVKGSLPEDQYGTEFQLTASSENEDRPVRQKVEELTQWMRVPVRYEEIGSDGTVVFQEDYGDKNLYDDYSGNRACLKYEKEDAFRAYCSADATSETLLLSMPIKRNNTGSKMFDAPFPFDVRLLDESGKVIESTNGNEGLIPVSRSRYENVLIDERDPFITEDLLSNGDVIGQEIQDSDDESRVGTTVVSDEVYEQIQNRQIHVPRGDYMPKSEVRESDEPAGVHVIAGDNQGKTVIPEEEWNDLDEGMASQLVIETELEEYDVETGEGDLCLPEPTPDRDRLKANEVFWKYVASQFEDTIKESVDEIYQRINTSDDWRDTIMELDEEDIKLSPNRFD
jgi:Molecular chaperone, HSP90 family